MAEAFFNATEGSGKKLHTFNRTIGANDVHDEYVQHGEPGLPTYVLSHGPTSIATANDHPIQLMAGATLVLYVRSILVYQAVVATAAAIAQFGVFRLSTAGTGGTAASPVPLDTTDSAGATGMTLPTAKGTEGARVHLATGGLMQTAPAAGAPTLLFEINFERLRGKALRIPNGTANGIAIKNLAAYAGASIMSVITFSEASF